MPGKGMLETLGYSTGTILEADGITLTFLSNRHGQQSVRIEGATTPVKRLHDPPVESVGRTKRLTARR